MIYLTKDKIKQLVIGTNKYYTYILCRNNGAPFYVGVGLGKRVTDHTSKCELTKGQNRLKVNTTKKELAEYGSIKYVLVTLTKDRSRCLDLEIKLIAKYGRQVDSSGILTNITSGGEGASGKSCSDKTKSIKSEIGLSRREEFSEYAKEQWRNYTPEQREVRLAHFKNVRNNEKARAKISATSKERWADPLWRAHVIECRRVARLKKLASANTTEESVNNLQIINKEIQNGN